MGIMKLNALFLTFLAIIFTLALTFASLELPKLTDELLHENVEFVNVRTGGGDFEELKTELFIRHFHLRQIGYISLGIVILLIVLGFITEKTGLTTLGAFAIFLPVFGHFAATMFFLGGLGFLRLLWLPGLDFSFDLMKLGDAVFIPYRIILDAFNLIGINLYEVLPYFFISAGLLIFCYGTLLWLNTYYNKIGIAKNSLYKYTRHPQYLGWIVWSYGILLLPGANLKQNYSLSDSLAWLLSTLIIVGIAMLEEIKMTKRYGESYNNYRKSSYFMLPLPKYACKVVSAPFRVFFEKRFPTRKREIVTVLSFYFALVLILTAVLNYSAKMEAPGRWVFENEDMRSIQELVNDFVESPERRAKYTISQLMISRGNSSVPYFIELLNHPDYVIREFSVDALGELQSDKGIDPLIKTLSDQHWRVVNSAIRSLGNYQSEKAADALINLLDTNDAQLKSHIAGALVRIGTSKAIDSVLPLAEEGELKPSSELLMALSNRKSTRAEDLIIQYISDENVNIRRAAVISARNYKTLQIKDALQKALEDEDWEVRIFAEEILEEVSNT